MIDRPVERQCAMVSVHSEESCSVHTAGSEGKKG